MPVLQRILALLKKPFPVEESRLGAPKIITAMSLFVVFFLYVFQPFGISTLESNTFWICLGFGAMTFTATVVYEFLAGPLLKLKGKPENWTFGKWLFNNIGIMFAISLANFLFARLVLFGFIQWELFPHMLYGTLMIGIIPIAAIGGWTLMQQERKHQHIAENINRQEKHPPIKKQTPEPSVFDIPISQFRFAEALQNYVKIGYVNTEGQFACKTERTTLKHILQETKGSPIVRSHRSFLVNREAILSAEGNAQGLSLTLANCDVPVPVSRSHVAAFK